MFVLDGCMFILFLVITVMPTVGLYSQYSLIKARKHIGSFSIDTCGILIWANVLRIMFWFSKGFAINLFIQSFFVIAMTFALLQLCIQVGYKRNNSLTDLSGSEEEGFWRWKSIGPFVVCTVVFTAFMGILTAVFVYFDVQIYAEVIGLIAIGIQSCLGLPQLYNNQKSKSIQGLSIFMITTWFFGDFFKTIYFIVKIQPLQFILGGAIQLAVDLLIVIQILAFKQSFFTFSTAKQIPCLTDQLQNQSPRKSQYNIKSSDGI